MAEYGLIKNTTLTALANGLRDKGFVSLKEIVAIDCFRTKSVNATSDTDPTPTTDFEGEIQTDVIEIPTDDHVKAVDVVIDIGYYANPETTSTVNAGAVYLHGKTVTNNIFAQIPKDPPMTADRDMTQTSYEFRLEKDKYSAIKVVLSDMCLFPDQKDWFAVTVAMYPVDENGNRTVVYRETDDINKLSPSDMVEAINNYEVPVDLPEEAFQQSGNFANRFQNGSWDWYIDLFGDKVITSNITSLMSAFEYSKVESVPFTLNVVNLSQAQNAFHYAPLKTCPKIRGTVNTNADVNYKLLYANYYLRDVEDLFEESFVKPFQQRKVTSQYSCSQPTTFGQCYSLRTIPSWWYHFKLNPESTAYPAAVYGLYYNLFNYCRALDEARDVLVWNCNAAQTSDMFNSTFMQCGRLKSLTFETNNGQPIEVKWKNQNIGLTTEIGYSSASYFTDYNSGITADKRVTDDATYQALKNDPDWFTSDVLYSRYNHDSAVETINSLPDTSAYLATAGGTNTIKFKGTSGTKTDGGAINSLTAEEIAVAAAKGWTVSFV